MLFVMMMMTLYYLEKNIDFTDDSKGIPYNFKLRNLYYILKIKLD